MSGFIPLSVPNFGEKEAAYAAEAITSGWVSTSGAKVSEFEEALAAYVGMPRAVAANSGTSSLHLAAMAAGIRRGDEVIVPTLTFIAAVNPLTRYVGAEPIFIGCNDTLCIDPDAVEDFCANHCTLKEDGLYNNKTAAAILGLPAFADPTTGLHFQNTGKLGSPLGAEMIVCDEVADGTIIALDRRYALEMVVGDPVTVDFDRLIDCQLERAAVSSTAGFSMIFPDAVKVMTLKTA